MKIIKLNENTTTKKSGFQNKIEKQQKRLEEIYKEIKRRGSTA